MLVDLLPEIVNVTFLDRVNPWTFFEEGYDHREEREEAVNGNKRVYRVLI